MASANITTPDFSSLLKCKYCGYWELLLEIILTGFCILNTIFFSKKAIKGNLCRIGRSAKSALIS